MVHLYTVRTDRDATTVSPCEAGSYAVSCEQTIGGTNARNFDSDPSVSSGPRAWGADCSMAPVLIGRWRFFLRFSSLDSTWMGGRTRTDRWINPLSPRGMPYSIPRTLSGVGFFGPMFWSICDADSHSTNRSQMAICHRLRARSCSFSAGSATLSGIRSLELKNRSRRSTARPPHPRPCRDVDRDRADYVRLAARRVGGGFARAAADGTVADAYAFGPDLFYADCSSTCKFMGQQ